MIYYPAGRIFANFLPRLLKSLLGGVAMSQDAEEVALGAMIQVLMKPEELASNVFLRGVRRARAVVLPRGVPDAELGGAAFLVAQLRLLLCVCSVLLYTAHTYYIVCSA